MILAERTTHITRLYLPLLAHTQPQIRSQAAMILLITYGDHALTYIRRLINDPDMQVRQDARIALLAISEITGHEIKLQPFRGIYIECLGRLRVYIGNHEMQSQDWVQADAGRAGKQKVAGVLAYLVHCGRRGASRKALGEAVWGDEPSASSMARTLTALRQALDNRTSGSGMLERALVIENDFCLLDPDICHTDVHMFERAYDLAVRHEQDYDLEQAAPLYTQVVQLYGGPYMADVLPGSGWSWQRREHLMSSFVLACERLAEYYYTHQKYNHCIEICSLAIDSDDAADDIVVWLLRAYAKEGRNNELRQLYRRYLRTTAIDPNSEAMQQDSVVQEYNRLGMIIE